MAQENLHVNDHRRAFQQHKRTPAIELQGVLDAARPSSPAKEPWWKQYFTWEPLTVAGRTIEKGWVVPQPLGIALLLVMISGTGLLYWRIIDKQTEQDKAVNSRFQEQRDLLIRLDERVIQKNESDKERQRKFQEQMDLQALKLQDLKDRFLVTSTKRGG